MYVMPSLWSGRTLGEETMSSVEGTLSKSYHCVDQHGELPSNLLFCTRTGPVVPSPLSSPFLPLMGI